MILRQIIIPSKENSTISIPAEFYGTEMEKSELMQLYSSWLEKCIIQPVILSTIKLAQNLAGKYDFQVFDGIIVAAALDT